MLGTKRDREDQSFRPTIEVCSDKRWPVNRLMLLYQPEFRSLAENVQKTLSEKSCCETLLYPLEITNPWDFDIVYEKLWDFAVNFKFDCEAENYYIHMGVGTHVELICLFRLAELRIIPAQLLQAIPPQNRGDNQSTKQIDPRLPPLRQKEHVKDCLAFLKNGIKTENLEYNKLMHDIAQRAMQIKWNPMLLLGPTGTGKTYLANLIYEWRKNQNLAEGGDNIPAVNCATLVGGLVKSELFGHKKGAFTDAKKDHQGILKSADKGMVFLDEIGELPLDVQAMLLKAIEEGKFRPLGADEDETSNFQLICGTNKDLKEMVKEGKFREDLYERINFWTYRLPALRERPEDIEPMLEYELDRVWNKHTSTGKEQLGSGARIEFNDKARKSFIIWAKSQNASWPGNWREFSTSIQRMASRGDGIIIDEKCVEEEKKYLRGKWDENHHNTFNAIEDNKEDTYGILDRNGIDKDKLDLPERAKLSCILKQCAISRNAAEAAKILYPNNKVINHSQRIGKYLAKYGLSFKDIRATL